MKPNRRKRLMLILATVAGVGLAAALVLTAFRSNIVFFYPPADVLAGKAPAAAAFRLGGLVEKGSISRLPDSVTVNFIVTDLKAKLPVRYSGILPDLFREGQGVVAQGRMGPDGVFVADEVLAKHDENYMPPEVAAALNLAGGERNGSVSGTGQRM
jgi:cytochrome c-type biogenesis protein CcmE